MSSIGTVRTLNSWLLLQLLASKLLRSGSLRDATPSECGASSRIFSQIQDGTMCQWSTELLGSSRSCADFFAVTSVGVWRLGSGQKPAGRSQEGGLLMERAWCMQGAGRLWDRATGL